MVAACVEEVQPETSPIDDVASNGALVAQTVDGAESQTLRLENGALLEIPRGALSSKVRVSVERPPNARAQELVERLDTGEQPASAPYLLEPHGQTFSKPVKLTLPIARELRDQEIAAVWLAHEGDWHWQRVPADRADRGRATILLEHFGVVMLVIARGHDPWRYGCADGGAPDATSDGASDGSLEGDAARCEPGTMEYRGMVVDATNPDLPIPGITVEVLNDDSGLPLTPPVSGVAGSDGRITLRVDRCKPFAVKARGNADHVDTYSYHMSPETSARPDALLRMASNNAAALVPLIAQYPVMQDRAPVAGAVYWKTPDMQFYDVVGCAHIETLNGTIPEDWALRYFAEALPSSLADWPLSRGTRRGDGRFFLGNAGPGAHTLVASVNGLRIGETSLVIFPRSMGSTLVNGAPENFFLAGIYIDAPAGAVNPTPANCQQ